MSEYPTEKLSPAFDDTDETRAVTARLPEPDEVEQHGHVNESQPQGRLHTPKFGLLLLPIASVLMVLLALFAWGGLFGPAQLGLVIFGVLLFTLAGAVTLWRSRSLLGAAIGWLVAGALLCAPLLTLMAATGGVATIRSTVFGAIALWVSGTAVVALVTAVVCLFLHARTYR